MGGNRDVGCSACPGGVKEIIWGKLSSGFGAKCHVLLEASNLDVGVQVAHVYDPGVVLEQAGWRWAVRARSYDGYRPSGTGLGEMRNRVVDHIWGGAMRPMPDNSYVGGVRERPE